MHNVQWLEKMRTDNTVPAKVRAHLDSATKAEKVPANPPIESVSGAHREQLDPLFRALG